MHVPLDPDAFTADNSGTREEGIPYTCQGFCGYAPVSAFPGEEGWVIGIELQATGEQMEVFPFSFSQIYTYAGIVALLVLFPGPNTVLVMQSVCTDGRRAGFFNVTGIVTAVSFNALISGLGLSIIVLQYAELYSALKLLGACYIAYLGIAGLFDALKLHRQGPEPAAENGAEFDRLEAAECRSGAACYWKGLLSGVLNPKSAVFFLAFFPLFLHRDGNIAVQWVILTAVYTLVSAAWYCSLVLFVGKLRRFLARRRTQKWLKAVTGTILLGMGIRLATQK